MSTDAPLTFPYPRHLAMPASRVRRQRQPSQRYVPARLKAFALCVGLVLLMWLIMALQNGSIPHGWVSGGAQCTGEKTYLLTGSVRDFAFGGAVPGSASGAVDHDALAAQMLDMNPGLNPDPTGPQMVAGPARCRG